MALTAQAELTGRFGCFALGKCSNVEPRVELLIFTAEVLHSKEVKSFNFPRLQIRWQPQKQLCQNAIFKRQSPSTCEPNQLGVTFMRMRKGKNPVWIIQSVSGWPCVLQPQNDVPDLESVRNPTAWDTRTKSELHVIFGFSGGPRVLPCVWPVVVLAHLYPGCEIVDCRVAVHGFMSERPSSACGSCFH